MKELPKEVISARKNYKKLTEKLNLENTRYRWEIPEGLSFTYKSKRVIVKTIAQMNKFLNDHCEDPGNSDVIKDGE